MTRPAAADQREPPFRDELARQRSLRVRRVAVEPPREVRGLDGLESPGGIRSERLHDAAVDVAHVLGVVAIDLCRQCNRRSMCTPERQ